MTNGHETEALELYQPLHADITLARPPAQVLEEAKQAAQAVADVVTRKKRPVVFNGEQYLEFEDWQTVARFYGITAKVKDTKFVQFDKVSGFEATAEALLVSTGQIISSADAMCLNDERNWSGKPMFQLRSMAQTRACAKALRNVLAWVVVLAGYKPTPAEEMQEVFGGTHNSEAEDPPFGPPPEPAPSQEVRTISEAQGKRLFAIAKKSGFSNDQIKAICMAAGYSHSKDIQSRHYEKMVEAFQLGTPDQTETIATFMKKWAAEN